MQLHDYESAAAPFAKTLDRACQVHRYSQLRAFAQIAAESAWNPNAQSAVGAIGICQIMPETADDWGVDAHDPYASIDALVAQMAAYTRRYGSFALALAAYDAGEGAVERTEPPSVPPYAETEGYVAKITAAVEAAGPYWLPFWGHLLTLANGDHE